MDSVHDYIGIVGAVLTGVVGGLLFTFSNFVMQALNKMPDGQGMRAMQLINQQIMNPIFGVIFFGSALVSLAGGIYAGVDWQGTRSFLVVAASLLYFLCTIVMTAAGNVPLNNKLDPLDAEQDSSYWQEYHAKWMPRNHVRTVSCFLASALFAISLTV